MKKFFSILCLVSVLMLTLISGCTTGKTKLPAINIKANPQAFDSKYDLFIDKDLSSKQLFDFGFDAFENEKLDNALSYFAALLKRHPQAIQASSAAYNAGLIYEKQKKYHLAVTMYQRVIEIKYNDKDIKDAHFRILHCYHNLSKWSATIRLIEDMIEHPEFSADKNDEIELQVRRMVAMFYIDTNDVAQAKEMLEVAFRDYMIGVRRGLIINEVPGALAAFTLAMIERKQFDEVMLKMGSQAEMLELMGQKALHLQNAQKWFLRCIEQDNAKWAALSGQQIGLLYFDFYKAIKAVEVPLEFEAGSEESIMYRCILSKQVQVLLEKSMHVFNRTLEMSERLRIGKSRVEQIISDLKHVEDLYINDGRVCEDVLPKDVIPAITR